MKTIILTLLICLTSSALFAQVHKAFAVKELDSMAAQDTSAYHVHPYWLDIAVNDAADFNAKLLEVTTLYKDDFSRLPFYTAKHTQTTSTLLMPVALVDLQSTIDKPTGYLIVAKLNLILKFFGVEYDEHSPLNDLSKVILPTTTP